MKRKNSKGSNYNARKINIKQFQNGIRHGIPIGLGYFFVSFTLGIAAKNAGLNPLQAALMSFSMHASAGEFAALGVIASSAGYIEMAVTELIINLRYLLMSCALSQKISKETKFYHRFLLAFDITDEIFAFSVSVPDKLNPFFTYGMMAVASPGWVIGTFIGAAAGGVLPAVVTGAMSIALYAMFLSVVIPQSKKDGIIAGVVGVSMAVSGAFSLIPVLKEMSSGSKIILLTVIISAVAALLFPVKEDIANDSRVKDDISNSEAEN